MLSTAKALAIGAAALLIFIGVRQTASAQQGPYSNYGGYVPGPAAPVGDGTTVYGGPGAYAQPPYGQAPAQPAPGYQAPQAYSPPAPQAYSPPAPEAYAPSAPQPAGPDLVQVLQTSGQFQTFLQLAEAAGFTDALHRGGPYTVLAPTEAAFARLPQGSVRNMLSSQAAAISFVRFHLIQGQVRVADMIRGNQQIRSLQGNTLQFGTRDGHATVNGAPILLPDLVAQNGIIQGLAAFALPVYPSDREGQREPQAGADRASSGYGSSTFPAPSTSTSAGSGRASPTPDPGGPAFYR